MTAAVAQAPSLARGHAPLAKSATDASSAAAIIAPPPAQHTATVNDNAPTSSSPSTATASSRSVAAAVGDVEAKISFLHPEAPTAKGELFFYSARQPQGAIQETIRDQEHPVLVHDLRPFTLEERRARGWDVDHAGFEVVEGYGLPHHVEGGIDESKFEDEPWIKSIYYADVDALLLKRFPEATSTVLFDHTLRRRDPTSSSDGVDPSARQPLNRAHIDQSDWAGWERVRLHLGDEALQRARRNDDDDAGRYSVRLVNVWRPLRDNIDDDWPLAVGDYRTFDAEKDLVMAEFRFANRTGETLMIRRNTAGDGDDATSSQRRRQVFHYLSGHRADEALLLQCWNSSPDQADKVRTPHTAFDHPGRTAGSEQSTKKKKPRWSIEVRALVITDLDAVAGADRKSSSRVK